MPSLGDSLGGFEDSGYSTPGRRSPDLEVKTPQRRRRGRHSSSESQAGLSLAFELAHADSYSGNADLLAEFGLDEADADQPMLEQELEFEQDMIPTSPVIDTSRARRKPSVASFGSFSPTQRKVSNTDSILEEEEEELAELDHVGLHASISSVDTFLSRIRNYTTEPQSNVVFLNSASGPDRQPDLEVLITTLVQSLSEQTKLRETQIRELKEYNHLLSSRSDPDWFTLLGEIAPITSCTFTPLPVIPIPELRSSTNELLFSLSTLSESSQVNRSSNNDLSRKLKSLKTVLSNLRTEADGLEASRGFVHSWSALREGKERSNVVVGRVLGETEGLLKEASRKASLLLAT